MKTINAIGRPPKVTYSTYVKLADAIQHNATVSDACRHARISRDTFYRHLKDEPVFTEMMIRAYENQNKVVFSFLTTY
jgi:AcrR family transcriptional regulator